jgi:hypothetical protein
MIIPTEFIKGYAGDISDMIKNYDKQKNDSFLHKIQYGTRLKCTIGLIFMLVIMGSIGIYLLFYGRNREYYYFIGGIVCFVLTLVFSFVVFLTCLI